MACKHRQFCACDSSGGRASYGAIRPRLRQGMRQRRRREQTERHNPWHPPPVDAERAGLVPGRSLGLGAERADRAQRADPGQPCPGPRVRRVHGEAAASPPVAAQHTQAVPPPGPRAGDRLGRHHPDAAPGRSASAAEPASPDGLAVSGAMPARRDPRRHGAQLDQAGSLAHSPGSTCSSRTRRGFCSSWTQTISSAQRPCCGALS
jgi:hypothetical protein